MGSRHNRKGCGSNDSKGCSRNNRKSCGGDNQGCIFRGSKDHRSHG